MNKATIALMGFLAVSAATPATAAPIFFDDFETEALGTPQPSLANWTISSGTIDVVGAGGAFAALCAGSPTPGRCIDLDGSSSPADAGRIETDTSFLLDPGTATLSFWLAGNQRGGPMDTVRVTVGTDLIVSIDLASSVGWALYSFPFATAGGLRTIVFDHAGGDNVGILLDNVSLSQDVAAIPEPTSLVLFGTGAVMALRRRRAAQSK